jgi:hypothetical protein
LVLSSSFSSPPFALVPIPFSPSPKKRERDRKTEPRVKGEEEKRETPDFFYFGLGNTLPSREETKRLSSLLLSPSFFELRFISPSGVETVGPAEDPKPR